ncbi:hypothetical protein U9M48_012102 [Paspalum notatum var. saurae]|uniref:Uncharacterized protein n=1 Tax=Paspalum notatum var. saurae TaxID=547442 RepID=A0AAQ3SX93_PASNO
MACRDIERVCKRFFWAGTNADTKGKCMVAWPVVARPCVLGGLGVLNIRLFNIALHSRWLWLQRVDGD